MYFVILINIAWSKFEIPVGGDEEVWVKSLYYELNCFTCIYKLAVKHKSANIKYSAV